MRAVREALKRYMYEMNCTFSLAMEVLDGMTCIYYPLILAGYSISHYIPVFDLYLLS